MRKKILIHLYIVTILILVDGFLQSYTYTNKKLANASHNPYFSRWFSAIELEHTNNLIISESHNPYFSRWFSAINFKSDILDADK